MSTSTDRMHHHRFASRVSDPSEPPTDHDSLDLRPASVFEAITRQMVESLTEELREIKSRLNGLIFMTIGAILLEIVSRMMAA